MTEPQIENRDAIRARVRVKLDALKGQAETRPSEQAETQLGGLTALLDETAAYIRRYVVLSADQAASVALWAAHTHAIDAAECSAYLHVTAATKRAGKTRLLEVLELVVARPWLTGRASAAVLVRKMDAEQPTLLLDESDAAFKADSEYSEALRGILNSGYRRSGKSFLCVGQGANITYKDFSTFGAKAIAGIGTLPDTIADRAIPIILRRRMASEPVGRFRRRDAERNIKPLRDSLAVWSRAGTELWARRVRPCPTFLTIAPPKSGSR